MDNIFTEHKYYRKYKYIRNKFRKYDAVRLIDSCFQYLHKPTNDSMEEFQKHPWLVLLLVKWILIDVDIDHKGQKSLTQKDLIELLQLMRDIGDAVRMPNQYEHYRLFFRAIAYQQFIYQTSFNQNTFSRQTLLFSDLPPNHEFQTVFKEKTGLSIITFLELSLFTLARFLLEDYKTLNPHWYSSAPRYSSNEVQLFLSNISTNLIDFQTILRQEDDGQRLSSEYYEQTPFISYPLLTNGLNYLCVYSKVLFRCLEHYVYDTLKNWDANKFMNKFGGIFESYVERSLMYSGQNYVNEKQIKQFYGAEGNQIDFVVSEQSGNIFIDAKGVEMTYLGKVTHASKIVKDKSRNSILKAIEQSLSVLNKIGTKDAAKEILNAKENNYLLVVTFKELHLGNGNTFYEAVAKESIDQIFKAYSKNSKIPLENMYFITVDEFDALCEFVNKKYTTFCEVLEKAKADDIHPSTAKFDFSQHLSTWNFPTATPDFVSERLDSLFESITVGMER